MVLIDDRIFVEEVFFFEHGFGDIECGSSVSEVLKEVGVVVGPSDAYERSHAVPERTVKGFELRFFSVRLGFRLGTLRQRYGCLDHGVVRVVFSV